MATPVAAVDKRELFVFHAQSPDRMPLASYVAVDFAIFVMKCAKQHICSLQTDVKVTVEATGELFSIPRSSTLVVLVTAPRSIAECG